jgi:hypothetical protein
MTIKKRTITSFISSVNRVSNEYAYNFTIDYPDGILSCEQQEYIELNVLSFDMLNTMYNMNASNNTFRIKKATAVGVVVADVLCEVPAGNYTVKTLLAEIKTFIKSAFTLDTNITTTYNEAQNTYTFKKNSLATEVYTFTPISIGKLLNMTNNVAITITTSGVSTGLINLQDYSKVIVKTKGVSYYYSNIDNLVSTNRQFLSDIIFFKTKSDVEPFKVLKYNNEDGGNSFVYTIADKHVNSISFQLKNERDEYITDCPDYLMVVQYNIYEKEDHTIKNSLISINKIMSELYTALIFAMNRLKLLL